MTHQHHRHTAQSISQTVVTFGYELLVSTVASNTLFET